VSGRLISPGLPHKASKPALSPHLLYPQKSHQPTLPHKIIQEPALYILQYIENQICLIIPAATSTVSIQTILLTMCGITARWPTRILGFYHGYLHSNPRDATKTFEPAESMKWETGSCKLRNIGIGLVVSMGLNVIAQLCFATEVQGSARPTLGKRNPI